MGRQRRSFGCPLVGHRKSVTTATEESTLTSHTATMVQEQPALLRLQRIAMLDQGAMGALQQATERRRYASSFQSQELLREGEVITAPLLMLSGWAARVKILPDGRRQILNFLLPGELFGLGRHADPCASCSIVAISSVSYCHAPRASFGSALDTAYAMNQALDEAYMAAAVVRLGRMNARERLCDLFLELLERLRLSGSATGDSYAFPVTQEMLGDTLGMTSVHVNRSLQSLRRAEELRLASGRLTLPQPEALAMRIGRAPIRVSSLRRTAA